MARYAAFLRGVMPTNAKMPELKRAFERAGFTGVRSILGSGNLVFEAGRASAASLEKQAEAAMEKTLGRSFLTFVRPVAELQAFLATDPFQGHGIPADAKRTVTFLKETPAKKPHLPVEQDGVWILELIGGKTGAEVIGAHLPSNPKGPVFMTLLQKTFGKEQTTRTWETVRKVAR